MYRLTGGQVYATSFSNAGVYGCYDGVEEGWYRPVLERLQINAAALRFPAVLDDMENYGVTAPGILPVQLPIAAVLADQQAEMLANQVSEAGVGKCTLSTGIFVGIHAGDRFRPAPKGLKNQNGWRFDGQTVYIFEGQGGMAGSVQQWVKEELGLVADYLEIDALAESVPDAGGVLFIPALTGMMAPYWDQSARGTIFGLSRSTTKAHLLRALLEGIAYRVVDILRAAERETGVPLRLLRVGGGMSKSAVFCQILADLTGTVVERTQIEDPSRWAWHC